MSVPVDAEDLKDLMPTKRKSIWRTVEERQMSDLTWVLEWLERRQGKKKAAQQKLRVREELSHKANEKTEKKGTASGKKQKDSSRKVTFRVKNQDPNAAKKQVPTSQQSKTSGTDPGRHVSGLTGSYSKDLLKKFHLDIKDALALETTGVRPYRRQSFAEPTFQDTLFGGRRVGLLRYWTTKAPDTTYERKLKSLMEKGTEPKIETAKMLKPEEVLSCRYLRLSKNNIKTLLKLCKDAGMNVDIHPHMTEAEINAKKVFDRSDSVSL